MAAADQAVSRDPDAAREFAEAYGVNANAEDIIASNQARGSRELKIAQRIGHVDEDATEELGYDGAAEAAGVEEEDVRAFAVRGNFLVVVYEDDRGDYRKVAVPLDKDKAPKASADEEAAEAEVKGRATVLKAAREAREEQEALLNDAAAQGQQEASAKVQEAVEEAQKEVAKAAEKSEKAAEKAEAKSSSAKGSS